MSSMPLTSSRGEWNTSTARKSTSSSLRLQSVSELNPEQDVLRKREDKQTQVNSMLRKLYRLHNKYQMLLERHDILEKLIKRNQKNEVIKIKKLAIGDEPLNMQSYFSDDIPKPLKKRASKPSLLKEETTQLAKTVSSLKKGSKIR